jgi:di/tricarboxylate transporter
VALAILAGMVAVVTAGWADMLEAAMAAGCLMVLTRCCSVSDARRKVDWPVLIVIGAALGIGRAIEQSGAGSALAHTVIQAAGQDPWLSLAAVYAVTALVTEIMTNNAAVALVFPIALATSEQLNLGFMPFAIAIMMAGSASFATPFGYQTNLMVYGPGGYRFSDYLRIGVLMNLLVGLVSVLLIPMIWPLT